MKAALFKQRQAVCAQRRANVHKPTVCDSQSSLHNTDKHNSTCTQNCWRPLYSNTGKTAGFVEGEGTAKWSMKGEVPKVAC